MTFLMIWVGSFYRKSYAGQLMELGYQSLSCLFIRRGSRRHNFDQLISQTYFTGVEALPLVAFLAVVIGSATILQAITVMPKIGAGDYFGNVMVVVVIREVGPLFTAFLVAGRTGSALSTFLGNMKVQQEIDALRSMGINPTHYLIYPALAGTIISTFCLTVVFNLVAIFGGFFVVKTVTLIIPQFSALQLPMALFLDRILASMGVMDGVLGVVKPVFFGMLIALIACYHGINVSNDIRDVPKATTNAVVNSFVYIILFDSIFALPFLLQVEFL